MPIEREPSMPMRAEEIEDMIRAAFPNGKVTVMDTAGDGNHFAAEVTDESFRGKNRVEQQRVEGLVAPFQHPRVMAGIDGQAGLRVVVDHEHAPAAPGQGMGEMEGRGRVSLIYKTDPAHEY